MTFARVVCSSMFCSPFFFLCLSSTVRSIMGHTQIIFVLATLGARCSCLPSCRRKREELDYGSDNRFERLTRRSIEFTAVSSRRSDRSKNRPISITISRGNYLFSAISLQKWVDFRADRAELGRRLDRRGGNFRESLGLARRLFQVGTRVPAGNTLSANNRRRNELILHGNY